MDLCFDLQAKWHGGKSFVVQLIRSVPQSSTDGHFNVSFKNTKNIEEAIVTVTNVAGQQVLYKTYKADGKRFFQEVNIGSVAKDIYSLRVEAAGESFVQNVIIE